jgi:hypothetical protein
LLKVGGATVFLDTRFSPATSGPKPQVLGDAQDSSAVTVILVSKNTAKAYYQLEELAEAIHKTRDYAQGIGWCRSTWRRSSGSPTACASYTAFGPSTRPASTKPPGNSLGLNVVDGWVRHEH